MPITRADTQMRRAVTAARWSRESSRAFSHHRGWVAEAEAVVAVEMAPRSFFGRPGAHRPSPSVLSSTKTTTHRAVRPSPNDPMVAVAWMERWTT